MGFSNETVFLVQETTTGKRCVMICEVNSEFTLAHWISYQELGFGQPVDLPLYSYSLKYDIIEMCGLIAEDANAFIQEMKLDFEQTGDRHPEYLHDLDYPSIDVLIHHEAAFCEMVREFLYSELFCSSFPLSPPFKDVRWIINSVNTVRYHRGVVEVLGQAYQKVE